MKLLLDHLILHAPEIGTFLITAAAAWIKRKMDLKKIHKEIKENKYSGDL
jgi:hypothetical protein